MELLGIDIIYTNDISPDTSYLEQDEFSDRLQAYRNDEFTFIGIGLRASVKIADTIQHIESGGLWGIESDSGLEYIQEIAKDEFCNLKEILNEIGITVGDTDFSKIKIPEPYAVGSCWSC